MGGKNPALIMPSADLDKASDGVMRSAFGAQGQKCSACSRVYVTKEIRDEFVRLLVEKTKKIKIGNPLHRDVYMGPVINEDAVKTYERAVADARRDGGKILTGGRRLTDGEFAHGYFVEPTIIDGLPTSHPLFSEELFVPITVIGDVTVARRSHRPREQHRVRAHRRHVLGGRPRDSAVLRPHPGRRHLRRTGAPARRPARGRASTRSAAGKRAARPAAAPADRTTFSSSCGNSRG